MATLSFATVLLISLVIEPVCGAGHPCTCPTEGFVNISVQCMQECYCKAYHCDWVNATVPVEVIKLFTPDGICTREDVVDVLLHQTCAYVKKVTELYVKPRDSSKTDVETAMQLIRQSINKVTFSCSNITEIRKRLLKNSLQLKSDHELSTGFSTVFAFFYALSDEKECQETCKDDTWLVCSVAATLLNITLDKKTTLVEPTCQPEPATPSPTVKKCQVDQATQQAMEWVRDGIPVRIPQLFLPETGLCSSNETTALQHSMCNFVKTLTRVVRVSQSELSENSASMHEAISKEVNFNCSDWKGLEDKAKHLKELKRVSKALKLKDKKLSDDLAKALHTVADLVLTNNKTHCQDTCKDQHVCGVTVGLFDLFSQPLAAPATTQPNDNQSTFLEQTPPQPCRTLLKDWEIYMSFTSLIVPVNISELFLPQGLCNSNLSQATELQSTMCNFTEALTKEYLSAKFSCNNKTTYVCDAIDRLGSNKTVDFNCSQWLRIAENASESKKQATNTPVSKTLLTLRDSVFGFFANKNAACRKECKGHWKDVCGLTAALLGVLPEKPKPTAKPTTTPTPSENKTNNASATSKKHNSHDTSPASPPQEGPDFKFSAIVVIIIAVGVAVLAYIAYYNREVVQKVCNLGGKKKGRPKRKNYKHLKSVKDALA